MSPSAPTSQIDGAKRNRVRPGGRSERVRAAVLNACLELLTEGKVELPIAEVAERSGVNRGTVYRWWPTQTELLNDALDFHDGHRTDAPDTGSWETDVRLFITQLAALAIDPVERGIMATMVSGRYPSLNDVLMGVYRADLPDWFAMVGRAVGRGEVAPDVDTAMLVQMMLSPAISVSLFEGRGLTSSEITSLVTLICRATHPDHATGRRAPVSTAKSNASSKPNAKGAAKGVKAAGAPKKRATKASARR